jgi:hypothetical protein
MDDDSIKGVADRQDELTNNTDEVKVTRPD